MYTLYSRTSSSYLYILSNVCKSIQSSENNGIRIAFNKLIN